MSPPRGWTAIERVLFWTGEHRVILVIKAFFDESGKLDSPGEEVVAIGGCIGSLEKLKAFEVAWNAILANYGVKCFHAVDFAHSAGEFEGWDKDQTKRQTFLEKLLLVMDGHFVAYTGSAIILGDYLKLNENERRLLVDPYYACFQVCVRDAAVQTLEEGDNEKVECIFSRVKKMTGYAFELYQQCKDNLDLKDRLADTFISSTPQELPQLQAADLVAYEMRLFVMRGVPFDGPLTINDVQKPPNVRWPMWKILLQKPSRSFFHLFTLEGLKNRSWI